MALIFAQLETVPVITIEMMVRNVCLIATADKDKRFQVEYW